MTVRILPEGTVELAVRGGGKVVVSGLGAEARAALSIRWLDVQRREGREMTPGEIGRMLAGTGARVGFVPPGGGGMEVKVIVYGTDGEGEKWMEPQAFGAVGADFEAPDKARAAALRKAAAFCVAEVDRLDPEGGPAPLREAWPE